MRRDRQADTGPGFRWHDPVQRQEPRFERQAANPRRAAVLDPARLNPAGADARLQCIEGATSLAGRSLHAWDSQLPAGRSRAAGSDSCGCGPSMGQRLRVSRFRSLCARALAHSFSNVPDQARRNGCPRPAQLYSFRKDRPKARSRVQSITGCRKSSTRPQRRSGARAPPVTGRVGESGPLWLDAHQNETSASH